MNTKSNAVLSQAHGARGFALVLTLLVLVMLTVLVVGFNAATRTEQMAARNFSYQGVAAQMAETAVSQGIALLQTNVTNGVVTQPGRAWKPGVGFVDLSSAALGSGSTNMNLNVSSADAGETNYFISTNTNTAHFRVPLVDVRVSNVLVGRYGFWIDDDGSRVNLNAAWTNARTNFLPTNSRPYSLAAFTNLPNFGNNRFTNFGPLITNTASGSTQGWSYFFTARQLMMMSNFDIGTYQKLMFQVAGGPGNQARATFALAPTNGQGVAIDAGGLQGMLSVHGDRRYTNSLANLTAALDGMATKFFSGAKYRTYFGSTNGLLGKYGPAITRQIIANINDMVLPTGTTNVPGNVAVTGANAADMLLGGIPRLVAGYRPFPFLNEIASRTIYHIDTNSGRLNMQVWLAFEIANPYNTAWGDASEVVVELDEWSFKGSYTVSEGTTVQIPNTQPAVNPTWLRLRWPAQTNLPARSYTNLVLALTASNIVLSNGAANIQLTNRLDLKSVRYLQWPLPAGANTVRDWAHGPDLPVWESTTSGGSMAAATTAFTNNGQVTNSFPTGGNNAVFGVAKNDPRVRRFPSYDPPSPPWLRVGNGGPAVTIGSNNSTVNFAAGTGVASAPSSDKTTNTSNDIMTHESFARDTLRNTFPARDLLSAFDLAQVHTGLQWRTLQFRAQDTAEAGSAPDWALLEIFTVTNSPITVPAKLNVNSQSFPAGSSPGMNANNLLSAGMARPLAMASLLAGNTNGNSATNAQIGATNAGIPASAVFPASGASSYLAVASNIARLDFSAVRSGNRPTNLPSNSIVMLSEVLEVNGVSNVGNDESANEGRVRGFYDALAAASDVFTIYSVGYAMDRNTNVTGESFLRTQVARDSNNPTKFRVIFSEPLIWK
jgi:hypothetical protein